MTTPCLAHYGVTVAEPPVRDDRLEVDPPGGDAAAGLDFLRWLGFEPLHTNLYAGIGRQWILRRGEVGEPGYLERDLFTSFRAAGTEPAGGDTPRAGDAVFRLPVEDPAATLAGLRERGWAAPYAGVDGALFRGPDAAVYELTPITGDDAVDRTISLWTDPVDVPRAVQAWSQVFGLELVATGVSFHGIAEATVLQRRDNGPVTLQLLTPPTGVDLPARVTDDIFAQQGYPHFRLGAPDTAAAQRAGQTVFPDTGDVSYLLIEGAYLELVQLEGSRIPA
ncbi:MAG: hypothetical protein ACRDZ2_08620 [Ilumatobacteraceae bacterium]